MLCSLSFVGAPWHTNVCLLAAADNKTATWMDGPLIFVAIAGMFLFILAMCFLMYYINKRFMAKEARQRLPQGSDKRSVPDRWHYYKCCQCNTSYAQIARGQWLLQCPDCRKFYCSRCLTVSRCPACKVSLLDTIL
jgi:hypothetical protein